MAEIQKDFTIVTDSNKIATIEVLAHGYYESDYGADADGNRGVPTWFLDGFTYDIPTAFDDGSLLSDDEKTEVKAILERETFAADWDFENGGNLYV